MESSSVSQESLDCDDYEILKRRNRIKTMRARSSSHKESVDSGDVDHGGTVEWGPGDGEEPNVPPVLAGAAGGYHEHDSPTRVRITKDKRCRPNHLHKNRQDKRRLREKRRSTGVMHMASTESTGDSLDEDDGDRETRRNTVINAGSHVDAASPPKQVGSEWHAVRTVRSKSPSDLEADLEDNQEYDSTASHSETNLTMIGHLTNLTNQHEQSPLTAARMRAKGGIASSSPSSSHHHPHYHHHQYQYDSLSSRPLSYPSKLRGVSSTARGGASSGTHSVHRLVGPMSSSHIRDPESALLARIRDLEMEVEAQKCLVEERDNRIMQLEKQITSLSQKDDSPQDR